MGCTGRHGHVVVEAVLGLHHHAGALARGVGPVKRGITRDYTPFLLILQGMTLQLQGIALPPPSNITREVTHRVGAGGEQHGHHGGVGLQHGVHERRVVAAELVRAVHVRAQRREPAPAPALVLEYPPEH